MIFNFDYVSEDYDSTYPPSIVELKDQLIENVNTFRYLGDEIKYDEPIVANRHGLAVTVTDFVTKF